MPSLLQVGSVGVLAEVNYLKVTEMLTIVPKKPLFQAICVIAGLCVSTLVIATDTSQLIGKDLDHNRDLVNTTMAGRNYMVQVDQQGKIKQIIDTGANGDGTAVAKPVALAQADTGQMTGTAFILPRHYQGQDALDFIGNDLPKVADNYGFSTEKFTEILLSDTSMRVDSRKQIFYVDDTADQQAQAQGLAPGTANGATPTPAKTQVLAISTTTDLTTAFKLHSKPGASKTIYLNFTGYTASGTAWSNSTIKAPAYDLTGNPAVFDNNERSNIISIWNRVAEDYSPFDVDVTTEPPSADALLRSSAADTTYGTQVVITKASIMNCNCGGIAYVGVVSMVNNTAYQPAWVFQDNLANYEKYIAEAAAHEAGHTLGLIHDGQKVGSTLNAYYFGHGASPKTTGWAPIMGAGYYENVTQWDHGVYPGANNQQDDLAVMASNGILPRTDDIGNTFSTASSLNTTTSGSTATVNSFGVIEIASDVDMFMINTGGGTLNLTVNPAATGPNLDVQLKLYKADGTLLTTSAPVDSLSAGIQTSVAPGTYFLAVSNSGRLAVGTDYGYPSYASLGQYAVTGNYTLANPALPPHAAITASTTSGIAALLVNFSANNTIGNGNIIAYQWDFGDGNTDTSSNPVHTYTNAATYTAKLTVTNEYLLTNTTTQQIVVSSAPQTTLHVSVANVIVTKNTSINATAGITVIDGQGHPVANATINGTWSGTFNNKTSSVTAANGTAIASSNNISATTKSGSAIFTIDSIIAKGYTYNASLNSKSVITQTW